MGTHSLKQKIARSKRVVAYARVSTEEQTKGLYPSCDSQIEELVAFCESKGWTVYEEIKDEGYTAGTLKRPGLARLRWLVETEQIDGVICTWYDRFTRSREFYVVDREFKAHNVDFATLHDRADRATASGRFMEMMLVAAKTYEREQTGEKVRFKLRMRAEKGMWNGGIVSFGFLRDAQTQIMYPNEEQAALINQLFQVYVETSSDHRVRDWLKAHRIPSPGGKPVWTTSTVRDLLCNRRYVAEIEINKHNKGVADVPEKEAYRIIKAPYAPVVPAELFDLAQKIRAEKAERFPNHTGKNRIGKPRSYSQSRPARVYLLQGVFYCAECGHPMSPHYVFHKAGYGRKRDSYICHYVCAKYKKYGTDCDHKNRVLARGAEEWLLGRVKGLVESKQVIERALAKAREKMEAEMSPHQQALAGTQAALRGNSEEIDAVVATATAGGATGALMGLLNQRAHELQMQRESLLTEQRRLSQFITPLERTVDASRMRRYLSDFSILAQAAQPEEMQRLLRLLVRRVEWGASGTHKVQFYALPTGHADQFPSKPSSGRDGNWFDVGRWSDASGRGRTDTSEETGF